jgi:parallel beta helix pectate lyase-like protein
MLNDGGAVICMDPGFYDNYFTITKSMTIDCLAGGGALNIINLTINAPSKTVRLRNIVVNAAFYFNTPQIDIQAASRVYLENILVTGTLQGAPGIIDHRAGPGVLTISNSSIVSNAGSGIVVAPASGTIGVELDNVRSADNNYGLAVGSGGRVMIKNSTFTGNTTAGIEVDPGGYVSVSGTEISFNSTGIEASGAVALTHSSINSNSTAISGATQSLGNNLIFANSINGTAPTIISGQ